MNFILYLALAINAICAPCPLAVLGLECSAVCRQTAHVLYLPLVSAQ